MGLHSLLVDLYLAVFIYKVSNIQQKENRTNV